MDYHKNILANVHQFIHWDWGQNYPFNGCMSFLLECLGEDKELYDYWFFSGISGDIFTMCYGNNGYFNDCVSVCLSGPDFIKYVFNKIGYEYTYVTCEELGKDKDKYINQMMTYIDKGIPVLQKGLTGNGNFDVIYEYSENGKVLSYMVGDEEYKGTFDTTQPINRDWIFIGDKIKQIPIEDIYCESVLQIPNWLNHSKTENGVTFGAKAFLNWAEDVEQGRYNSLDMGTFDLWKDYTIYVCNLATNSGGSREFLNRALQYNPELSFIPEMIRQYQYTGELWKELEAVGGGFNVSLEILKDPNKRKIIASKIREFSVCMEKVAMLINILYWFCTLNFSQFGQ